MAKKPSQPESQGSISFMHIAIVACVALAALIVYRLSDDGLDSDSGQVEELSDMPSHIEQFSVRVIETHPHKTDAFTQGLLWHDGAMYESTGVLGESTLRQVNLEDGEPSRSIALEDTYFAEGLARVGERLIQLTWRSNTALVWDLDTFEPIGEFEFEGEGWGLCFDGERLIMSSGNDVLQFRDPETFEKTGEVSVRRGPDRLRNLNELECVDGLVYANVWMRDAIARIDPESGEVTGWIDASDVRPRRSRGRGEDVLNGIAFVPETGRFLITGKRWPELYEVEFVPED